MRKFSQINTFLTVHEVFILEIAFILKSTVKSKLHFEEYIAKKSRNRAKLCKITP